MAISKTTIAAGVIASGVLATASVAIDYKFGDLEADSLGHAYAKVLNPNGVRYCEQQENRDLVAVQNDGDRVTGANWSYLENSDSSECHSGSKVFDGSYPVVPFETTAQPYAAPNDNGYSLGVDDLTVKPSSDITFYFNDETVATVDGDDYFIEGVVPANTDISMDNGQIIIELEGQEPVTVDCNHAVITPQLTVTAGLNCGM